MPEPYHTTRMLQIRPLVILINALFQQVMRSKIIITGGWVPEAEAQPCGLMMTSHHLGEGIGRGKRDLY